MRNILLVAVACLSVCAAGCNRKQADSLPKVLRPNDDSQFVAASLDMSAFGCTAVLWVNGEVVHTCNATSTNTSKRLHNVLRPGKNTIRVVTSEHRDTPLRKVDIHIYRWIDGNVVTLWKFKKTGGEAGTPMDVTETVSLSKKEG